MLQVTKIVCRNCKINIFHSDSVTEKRDSYELSFDSVYKGYVDYYVNKDKVQSNIPCRSGLEVYLYVPTKKFYIDPEKWVDLLKSYYEECFGKYKWYKEPVLDEQLL